MLYGEGLQQRSLEGFQGTYIEFGLTFKVKLAALNCEINVHIILRFRFVLDPSGFPHPKHPHF